VAQGDDGRQRGRIISSSPWEQPFIAEPCCPRHPLQVPGTRMERENSTKIPAVLIVEDEPLVRLGAVKMIEEAGFLVIEAANADEAIRILESRTDIRAVFTDINMPGSMDGLKLAHAVRNRWPPIKIIVTSGRDQLTEQDLPEGGRFFAKPYDPIEITDTLRQWAL
jgi:two-component system, response regulator PdtaR